MKNIIRNFILVVFIFTLVNKTFSQIHAPTAEWKKTTWAPYDVFGNQITIQGNSGDEWWYSHKNLYDPANPTSQIGYIGVGYAAFIIHPNSAAAADPIYNEGANSCYNPNPSLTNFSQVDCSDTEVNGTRRSQYRGTVGFMDLNGNVTNFIPLTFIDLQEVITDATGIYVIGSHQGYKSYDKTVFLNYNPTSATPNNNFDLSSAANSNLTCSNSEYHMYIAKLDYQGNVLWQNIYGAADYNADNNEAIKTRSQGFDLIKNSVDGMIYASGYSFLSASSTQAKMNSMTFVVKIDPSNGYVLNQNALSFNNVLNSVGGSPNLAQNASICEIGNTGKMVLASTTSFVNPSSANPLVTEHGALVYSIDQNLSLNSLWTASNPILLSNSSTPLQFSRTWEVNYHNALNQIMVGVMTDCSPCSAVGSSENNGYIYRLNNNGQLASGTNPSALGRLEAYDIRVGVTETSDGGFAAVSARRNVNPFVIPTNAELGVIYPCLKLTNPPAANPPGLAYNSDYSNGEFGHWDTDPLVVKFNPDGTKKWEWSEDVIPGRPRQSPPGDCKRQECMYKISEVVGGGLVISGNNSYNYDDRYMVKLFSDCYTDPNNYDYAISGNNLTAFVVPPNQTVTWNSNKKILGKIRVDGTLIINGINTIIEFSDSSKTGIYSGIEISLGGKVIVNDATLTSFSGCAGGATMWSGIIMDGDLSQNQTQAQPPQPTIILNNAKIFNAKRAILTGMVNNIASGGGILKATNTTFKNNYIDVQFSKYPITSPNVSASTVISDVSFFYNCTFLADQLLNDPAFVNSTTNNRIPTKAHVVLNNNIGVKFTGCTFKTDLTTLGNLITTDDRGIGIQSFASIFSVEDYCTLIGPNNCVYSGNAKFENLQTGIIANSSNVLQNYKVENTNFVSCFKGIYQSGVNYSTIQNNNFTLNYPTPPPAVLTCATAINNINSIALLCDPIQYYLNECDGFKHANNNYSSLAFVDNLGTLFNFCSGTSNASYRNNYTSMLRGHQLQAGNTNLQIKCNTNTFTNFTDIAVTSGAVSTQGSCLNQLAPPNNLFSHKGTPGSDINSVSGFQYNFISFPNGAQIPLYYSALTNIQSCPNALGGFNYTQSCPVDPNPNCNGGCWLVKITGLTAAINQNNTILNAGSDSRLITLINTQSPGQVQNGLLTPSPYLSDVVLLAFLNKGFPNGTVKNVIEANQPVTNAVWQAVVNSGLPNGIFKQLEAKQVGTNARQQLVDNTNQLIIEKQSDINEGIRIVLNPSDSITDYSQAESLMKLDNTGGYYDDLVQLYFITHQFDNAQAYIDSLNLKPENNNLVSFLNLAKEAAQANGWEGLIQDPKVNGQLHSIAYTINTKGSALAQSVRNTYYEPSLYSAIEDFNNGTGARSAASTPTIAVSNTVSVLNNDYVIYPNPFNSELNIKYQLKNDEEVKMQLIEIGSGRVLYSKSLFSTETAIKFNTENLITGVYLICFTKTGEAPVYYKLVNLK